ncbi:MAG: (d)CMP kinase [Bacillota bacterium]|nr:(d)CMP kinase [Bacillota bacterium]
MQVAIDGPSGSGKSTIAKRIAAALGYLYLDTGAMYRAVALGAIRKGILQKATEAEIAEFAKQCDIGFEGDRVLLDGDDVTAEIRSDAVTTQVYLVAQNPMVREILVSHQRKIAGNRSVVMDGRDIGTVVLPDAEVKVFLTASPEARAKRRYHEIEADPCKCGFTTVPSLQYILDDVNRRDRVDSEREASPLCAAEDAVLIDSTEMSIEEVVQQVIRLVEANDVRSTV